ncbi:MAG: signal peptidase I [Alphaproteobacteria bacterium]
MPDKKDNWFVETVKTVVYALVLVVGVHSIFIKPFHIPSPSMIPTLLIGDYLFVTKFPYGYSKHSFPFSPPLFTGRILAGEPKCGDVAVFRPPHDPGSDWIKRVIGLPGDEVQMIDGVIHINGEKAKMEKIGKYNWRSEHGQEYVSMLYRETLPNGVQHLICKSTPFGKGEKDNTPVIKVPEGHYMMMGDNRDHSRDSRWVLKPGMIPFENLVGRAELVFFSTEIPTIQGAAWWKPWLWPTATRYTRTFTVIR